MKPVDTLLMICVVAGWGFNFLATQVVLEVFSSVQLAFGRSALTLLILLPWWKPFQLISLQLMFASLLIGAGSFYFLYLAIDLTDSLTNVAVGTQLMPPLTAVLAWLFYKERISPRMWLGIGIATAGSLYLVGVTNSELSNAAFGMTLLSIIGFSTGSIMIGKAKQKNVWCTLAWIAAVSIVPLGMMTATQGSLYPDLQQLELIHWLAFLSVVIISGLLGQGFLFHLYGKYPVSSVAPWMLLIPVFAGLFSVLFDFETISSSLFVGGAIILFGVWLQQGGVARYSRAILKKPADTIQPELSEKVRCTDEK